MGKTIFVRYDKGNGLYNTLELQMSELDVLVQLIKNTEDGFTYISPPDINAEYKMVRAIVSTTEYGLKYEWSAKDCGFIHNKLPSLWPRIQLRIILFFNL